MLHQQLHVRSQSEGTYHVFIRVLFQTCAGTWLEPPKLLDAHRSTISMDGTEYSNTQIPDRILKFYFGIRIHTIFSFFF